MPDNTGPNGVTGSNDPNEANEPRETNAANEPEEITGPPRPSKDLEPVAGPPEELRVVPIEPYYVEPYYAEFPEQDAPPEEPTEPEKAPRPERIKRAAVVGARVVTGTVGVLAAAAVVAAAALVPLPSFTATAPVLEVAPVETGQQLVCPGSVLALSESADTEASATTPLGSVNVTAGSTTGSVARSAFEESDAGSGGTDAAPQLVTAEVDPTAGDPLLLSAAQTQLARTESFFGLAASGCSAPEAESWLVGGATTTGRSTLITLDNPSTVAADVDLEIFGELGAVSAPGLTGITVAPGAQRVLSLAGFAPQLAAPVVHVTSAGGLVVASLQQTTVRGIEAGGMDVVGTSTAPSTTNVIPGVMVAGAATVASRLGIAGYEDLTPTLRVFVPGADATEARVTMQSEDSAAADVTFSVEVAGGVTVDLPIDDIVDGNYTISIDSDAPIVVGARVAAVGSAQVGERADFGWFASAAELNDSAMVSVPEPLSAFLHLSNPSTTATSVVVTPIADSTSVGTEGAARTVELAAGASAVIPAVAGASYELSGFDALRASVTAAVDGGVAGYTVAPRAESSTPVVVYP